MAWKTRARSLVYKNIGHQGGRCLGMSPSICGPRSGFDAPFHFTDKGTVDQSQLSELLVVRRRGAAEGVVYMRFKSHLEVNSMLECPVADLLNGVRLPPGSCKTGSLLRRLEREGALDCERPRTTPPDHPDLSDRVRRVNEEHLGHFTLPQVCLWGHRHSGLQTQLHWTAPNCVSASLVASTTSHSLSRPPETSISSCFL